jgi:hypothetical protein
MVHKQKKESQRHHSHQLGNAAAGVSLYQAPAAAVRGHKHAQEWMKKKEKEVCLFVVFVYPSFRPSFGCWTQSPLNNPFLS